MTTRPRLTPAMADVRRAVREALDAALPDARGGAQQNPDGGATGGWVAPQDAPLVLVALSGGPDSLALAVALGFEQAKCGVRAGAVIVDHGLQASSAEVAEQAAEHARAAGLSPVVVRRVSVTETCSGPEADARTARYAALEEVARETQAAAVLVGHTLDDQAETVLLGLARGSGARSLAGMRAMTERGALLLIRPLLAVRRDLVHQSLTDQGIEPWVDPHNADVAYARVRARTLVLPVLEKELGPGVAEALARTATQLTDDADYLDAIAFATLEPLLTPTGSLSCAPLEHLHPAIRLRCLRAWLAAEGDTPPLTAANLAAVDELVTNWHGQGDIHVPGGAVRRDGDALRLEARSQGVPARQ